MRQLLHARGFDPLCVQILDTFFRQSLRVLTDCLQHVRDPDSPTTRAPRSLLMMLGGEAGGEEDVEERLARDACTLRTALVVLAHDLLCLDQSALLGRPELAGGMSQQNLLGNNKSAATTEFTLDLVLVKNKQPPTASRTASPPLSPANSPSGSPRRPI